jgi:hypothetical protein
MALQGVVKFQKYATKFRNQTELLIVKSNIRRKKNYIFCGKKIKVWCTAFGSYLVTFMYYSRYISFINLYFMTINNKWVCREKMIYN